MNEETAETVEPQLEKILLPPMPHRLNFGIPTFFLIVIWIVCCLQTSGRPDAPAVIAFSLGILFASSLGFWLGMGNSWWRFWIVPLVGPLIGFMGGFRHGGHEQLEFQTFFLVIVAVVALTAFVLRVFKGQLKLIQSDDPIEDALQFGIRDLMIVTTIVAVVAAFGPSIVRWISPDNTPRTNILLAIIGFSAFLAISTVTSIWAFLGRQVSVPKILIVVMAIAATSAGAWLFMPGNNLFFALLTVTSQFLVAAALTALRLTGLRFAR
jgi:hypothetical protein